MPCHILGWCNVLPFDNKLDTCSQLWQSYNMGAAPLVRPASPTPAPSSPKRRNTSDGSSNGLRNCCEACASSKVKCSGRKPTCHRCEKRGFECEYFQAKRAGRKPAGSTSTTNNSSAAAPQPASEVIPTREVAMAAEGAYTSPRGTASDLSDIWADLNPLDRSLFSELSNIDETSFGLSPSFSMELPALDTASAAPTASMTSADNLYSSTMDSSLNVGLGTLCEAMLEASNDATADLFSFPLSTPRATGLATPVTGGSQSIQRSPTASQPCSCLAQALQLMRRLSELMSATDAAGATKSDADAIRTIQEILQQNKTAIDTATGMLNCQGPHDGYLLIIICLTAFKTLELFTAILPASQKSQSRRLSVVSSPDSGRMETTHVNGYRIEGGDWARQSAQAILSELHSVRRLTKLFSEKLRIQTATAAATSSSSSSSKTSFTAATTPDAPEELQTSSKEAVVSEGEAKLPFSSEVYRQLEVDLANRVKALTQQIIHRLRSF